MYLCLFRSTEGAAMYSAVIFRQRPVMQNAVNKSPFDRFFSTHKIITIERAFHFFKGSAAMFGIQPDHQTFGSLHMLRVNKDIRRLSLKTAGWLMYHNAGIRQRQPVACFTRHQQKGS